MLTVIRALDTERAPAPDTAEMVRHRASMERRHAAAWAELRAALDGLSADAANLVTWGLLDPAEHIRAGRRRSPTAVEVELGLAERVG